MSILKNKDLDVIISQLTPKIFTKKIIITSFLKEIFTNISKRSNYNVNTYTFQEILNIPTIISDKIYFVLNEHNRKVITSAQFSSGLYNLLYSNIEQKFNMGFEIFDFDNDGYVMRDDVFLILSHFHLIQNTSDTIKYIEKMIAELFFNDKSLKKDEFFKRCKTVNCNLLVLLFIFINNYIILFTKQEISFFEKECFKTYLSSANKNDDCKEINEQKSNFDCLLNLNYKITKDIQDYLNTSPIETSGLSKKTNDTDKNEEEESDSDSMGDLDELKYFEEDMVNIFHSLSDLILKEQTFKKKITKNRTFYPPKNKNLQLKPQPTIQPMSNIQTQKEGDEPLNSSAFDDTRLPTKKENRLKTSSIIQTQNVFKKASTSLVVSFNSIRHKKNEIILYKAKNNTKTNEIIKLSLVDKVLFYFKYDQGGFIYKKLLSIFALYVKKTKINVQTQLTFISTVHNFYKQYSFYVDNIEELETFITLFNSHAGNLKIADYYDIKQELGKGKFGSVSLAYRKKPLPTTNSNSKNESSTNCTNSDLFAIKIVNKNNPTDEEYKINRWESTIFLLLRNINHPNIIKCVEKFENEINIFFVYEYIKGCDLKNYASIRSHQLTRTKKHIVNISIQIIQGIACLHKYGIIHRDIKTTNIMVKNPWNDETNDNIKIIDFGLSRVLGKEEMSLDPYGSLCFKAPELIQHIPYNFKVDVWAIGVTIYYLMFGCLPFEKGSKNDIKKSIMEANLTFPVGKTNYIHDDDSKNNSNYDALLYAMICDCLEKIPNKRSTINILISKYIDTFQDDDL